MSIAKEFKEFINRGNVIDMAVGLVIGAAFGAVISSFVDNIISPLVGLMMGDVDVSQWMITLREAVVENGAVVKEALVINIGLFVNSIITFVLTAFALFLVVKMYNKLQRQKEEEVAGPSQEDLLTEIRDLLKKQ